uniref:uncharacterized protein LOC124067376 n=1 Tax=Scatophagus argus TaxID=75038 RepID=UPI001ED7F9BD|nr:uncharacterized protein LOC124067376 [Scatophagus argus]
MASVLMAWVWIGLALARHNSAEGHRYAPGRLDGQDELYNGGEELFAAALEHRSDRTFLVPVWNFFQGSGKGSEKSYFSQLLYRCSNGTLSLRISLIRYSNLRLADGTRLLSLSDRCHSSSHIERWWLLVKLHTGCHTAIQTGDGSVLYSLTLHYFDRMLQENMTGMAVCENPEMSPRAPLVTCGTTRMTVKLPRETKLKKVKELGFLTNNGFSVRQLRTRSALFVVISDIADRDSGFELVCVDSTGKMYTMLAACSLLLPKKVGRHHVRRSVDDPDVFDLWGFDDTPTEPFDPETPQTTAQTTQPTESPVTDTDITTTVEPDYDSGFNDFWGFQEIPEVPYDGVDVEIPGTTASTTTVTTSPATVLTTTTTTTTTTTAVTAVTTATTATTTTTTTTPTTTTPPFVTTTTSGTTSTTSTGSTPTTSARNT